MSKVLVKFLPFQARLILDSSINRNLLQLVTSPLKTVLTSSPTDRQLLSLDLTELTIALKEYFDDFLRQEFDGQTTYAPFSYVSISPIARRNLLTNSENHYGNDHISMDEVVDGKSKLEVELIPIRKGNLRTRRTELYLLTKTYDGVAVFDRVGTREIPTLNYFQAKQLQAQADENGILLQKLQNSDPSTGLNTVTEISLTANTENGPGQATGSDNGSSAAGSVDIVIVIAVVVAACSMILLGFALYLAYRRRQTSSKRKGKSKEISPRTKNTDMASPTSDSPNEIPPVRVMELRPDHDDNISEYTESVYSAPIRKAVKTQAQRQWLKDQAALIDHKSAKASSRFNPRYIISGRSNASSSDVESDHSHGASEEMEGVPALPTRLQNVAIGTLETQQVPPSKYTVQGAWTPSQIDDDISSSLNAYAHPVESSRKKKMKPNDDTSVATSTLSAYARNIGLNTTKDIDDSSVASFTSFGFSLDGVGDQSTIAGNSFRF